MVRFGVVVWLVSLVCATNFLSVISVDGLVYNYYNESCPNAEALIQKTVYNLYKHTQDNIPTSLIRWSFHDFFNGADGSFLLKSKYFASNTSEKDSPSQVGMRSDKYVNYIKTEVDKECPGIVSCADVLAVAGAHAVKILGGPSMRVKTGRRDSRKSLKSSADQIPNPYDNVNVVLKFFRGFGVNTEQAVALLGAHTIGRAHCVSFRERVYPKFDPKMDPKFAQFLKDRCPPNPPSVHFTYFRNDPKSPLLFDNHYYVNLLDKRGLMQIDDNLIRDRRTLRYVKIYAENASVWRKVFADAYIKISEYKPLTGKQGEIRKMCSFVNSKTKRS